MKLAAAKDRHIRGDLAEADRLYRAVLAHEPGNAEAMHLLGFVALQTGRWQEAADWIDRSLQVNPAQLPARLNLGVALRGLRRFDGALMCFERVLAIEPDHAEALNNRGDVLLELARPADALHSLDRALRQAPSFIRAHLNRAAALRQLNRLEEALAAYDEALRLAPDSLSTLYNRANTLLELKRDAAALQCYEDLLRRDPRDAESLSNSGIALLRLGRVDESLAALKRALELQPHFPRALNNLGSTLRKVGRLEEALTCHEKALWLLPHDPDSLSNRGTVLTELHRHPEAVASHELALAQRNDSADLFYNRGTTRLALRQMEAALQDFERALELRPGMADALYNRSVALIKLKRYGAAIEALDRVLETDPSYPYAAGIRYHCCAQVADWTDEAAARRRLIASVTRGERADEPFSFLSVCGSAAAQLRCARVFMAPRYLPTPDLPVWSRSNRSGRIRLAYVSGDLRDHPVSRLLAGVFEAHDRHRFEVIGVSLRPPEDSSLGRRVAAAFDQLIDVSVLNDAAVIESLRAMQIDVAIDLMGCTDGQRSLIFANRIAPVQVNFIGYPGTVGTDNLDYLIADRWVVPDDRQDCYAENIVYLPDCFQPNDDRRLAPANTLDRASQLLPGDSFVWCCFNNPARITAATFEIWMRLLLRTPDSILWLYVDDSIAETNLREAAQRQGVDARRLVVAARVPYEQHLDRVRLADVFLDTSPFNGGTTVSDALWAGVPVLTCSGDAFAARMAGSLLKTLGLPELVTEDAATYEDRALQLAASRDWLTSLRARLWNARSTSPLFDTRRYCRHLDSAYETMRARWLRGEPASTLVVES